MGGEEDVGSAPSSVAAESPISALFRVGMTLKECQDIIHKSFTNPKVKALVENMEKSGCKVPSNFIRAVNCRGLYAGGFSRGHGIIICANHMQFKDYVVQAVIHELIHAYDDCRAANIDWHNYSHQACSEIRANHLSGDCHMMREFLRGNLKNVKIKGHEPECVKRRSVQSVSANHSPATSKFAVDAVWSTCYNDTAPFNGVA